MANSFLFFSEFKISRDVTLITVDRKLAKFVKNQILYEEKQKKNKQTGMEFIASGHSDEYDLASSNPCKLVRCLGQSGLITYFGLTTILEYTARLK